MTVGARWAYSTMLPPGPGVVGDPMWHTVNMTFDSVEAAAEAAKRWLIISVEHGRFLAVRLERIDELPAA